MAEQNYSFFCHCNCEYFPCHPNVAVQDFNCLFCFCPLYSLGEECGGNFSYTQNGIKDCRGCTLPHKRENYDMIIKMLDRITERIRLERKALSKPKGS